MFISLLSAVLLFQTPSFADEDQGHTATVCAAQNSSVCAHLGLPKVLNSKDEGVFIAHVMTPQDQAVTDFKLDLFMDMGDGHGHTSAPVDITALGQNHFKIENAWFVMLGTWQVRLYFNFQGQSYNLIIPVEIKE